MRPHPRGLGGVQVVRREGLAPEVEEQYRCTSAGIFEVTLSVLDDDRYSRTFRMARGSEPPPPTRRRAARAARRAQRAQDPS
ncbi:MAG: hypothetical protein DMF77_20305 [Acidobacteria bacterium]|nr:MAG: hypothetical protein DMF77_20305 [Acidobacteriota bacterium]